MIAVGWREEQLQQRDCSAHTSPSVSCLIFLGVYSLMSSACHLPFFLTAPHPVPRGVQLSQPHTFRGRMTAHYLSCTRAFFLCPRVYTPRSLPRMWVQALCGSLRESASPRTTAHGLDGGNPWRDNILSYLRWAILIHILYSPYKLLSGIQPRCPQ